MAGKPRIAAKKAAPAQPRRHTASDVSMAKVIGRHSAIMATIEWLGKILFVAAFGVPLWFMQPMISALAGKTTNVNAVLSVSLVANIVMGIGGYTQYRRRKSQTGDLQRQRERSDTLESLLLSRDQPPTEE